MFHVFYTEILANNYRFISPKIDHSDLILLHHDTLIFRERTNRLQDNISSCFKENTVKFTRHREQILEIVRLGTSLLCKRNKIPLLVGGKKINKSSSFPGWQFLFCRRCANVKITAVGQNWRHPFPVFLPRTENSAF